MSALPQLAPEAFADYFAGIHGVPPFPWQSRLAARLARGDRWPAILDLPTGSGKTAAIDIAVFQLALQASAAGSRTAPLRIVYVVDRRTIVDQAHERALTIVRALDRAESGVLATVRTRLAAYGRDGEPLRTALLRGGIARSDSWTRSPDQPLIAVSTVDQVGSRLLFRGYGVSDSMKPIHAGLLATDTLYLLDEVHLSEPFRETLAAIRDRYANWGERLPARSLTVVEMSATPGRGNDDAFRLNEHDERHPLLSRRLTAPKPARLTEVPDRAFLAELQKQTAPLAAVAGTTVAVVVNRVADARDLHEHLQATLPAADVHLVTGRMRPLDRDALDARLFARIRAGRRRDAGERPAIVVATQCIEAGADFDFDVLVSECASLDALRQRFGRLDRLGELAGAAYGHIVARTGTLDDDAVYGAALGATWRWLGGIEGDLDFGIAGLVVPDDAEERGLLAPKPHAPILLPSHLDAWVQTSPTPTPDPDVALWLHGPERGVADVQIVWRADLSESVMRLGIEGDTNAASRAIGAVEALPPASGEAMPVPFAAARRWLDGRAEPDVHDVEGAREAASDEEWKEKPDREARAALAWRGERSAIIAAADLRPGDTIVVPTSYGGVVHGTWSPRSADRVRDLAEVAVLRQRGRALLRLHPDVIADLLGDAVPAPPVPRPADSEDLDDREAVADWLAATADVGREIGALLGVLRDEARRRSLRVERLPLDTGAGEYFLLSARRRVVSDGAEVTTEDDNASFTGVAVPLARHLAGVEAIAGEFAQRVGVTADMLDDVRLAGRWHDVGKVDPRFQRLLHGGSEYRALVAPEPLAKSAIPMNDRRARQQAQMRSGYPRGTRHELASLALLESGAAALQPLAKDWDLVQHLVASHHGRCRPLAPWVPDPAPVELSWELDGVAVAASSAHTLASLDSGVGERFWRLTRRYGWWGLAWLETLLRLGDHRRSEEEQRPGGAHQ